MYIDRYHLDTYVSICTYIVTHIYNMCTYNDIYVHLYISLRNIYVYIVINIFHSCVCVCARVWLLLFFLEFLVPRTW